MPPKQGQTSVPAILIRVPLAEHGDLRKRLRVACAEEELTYAGFLERCLDERDAARSAMRHPLDRAAVGR